MSPRAPVPPAAVAWKLVFIAAMTALAAAAAHSQTPAGRGAGPLPDLAVELKSTPLLRPNQEGKITVTVKNRGAATAPESDMDIIVRNGHAPREVAKTFKRRIRALEPGDKFSYTFSVKLSIGLYEVCGTSDRKKKIPDADRKNNESCLMIEGL